MLMLPEAGAPAPRIGPVDQLLDEWLAAHQLSSCLLTAVQLQQLADESGRHKSFVLALGVGGLPKCGHGCAGHTRSTPESAS
jgi:hypothetical protein